MSGSLFFDDIPLTGGTRQATISHKGFLFSNFAAKLFAQFSIKFLQNFSQISTKFYSNLQESFLHKFQSNLHRNSFDCIVYISSFPSQMSFLEKCFDFSQIRISKFWVKTIFAFEKTFQSNGPSRNILGRRITSFERKEGLQ